MRRNGRVRRIIHAITIDIGGTNVRVGVGKCNYNAKTAKVVVKPIVFKAPASQEELERQIGESMVAAKSQCAEKISMVGVSVAGIVDGHKSTLISLCNQPGWKNVKFDDLVRKYCPDIRHFDDLLPDPVYVENDAKSAALAQYYFGKHQNNDDLVYLTCSTGMGAGIIQDGVPLLGGQHLAGEVGHMIISTDPNAPICGCGQRGCWEAFVGMKNFARNCQTWLDFSDIDAPWYLKAKNSEHGLRSEDIFKAAIEDNDSTALYLLKDWVVHMAIGLRNVIVAYNPTTIVLGTVVEYWGEPLLNMINQELKSRFCGMQDQIQYCKVIANNLKNLDVLAPLAVAARHHSLTFGWRN